MKNIINKTLMILSAAALMLTVSCTKEDTKVEQYLEVNASNLHGNWQLETQNGSALEEGAFFYINFNRSGQEYKSWNGMGSIPNSYDYSEGTFDFYNDDPELGITIRGIDNALQDWNDRYVIKDLTKTHMTWIGVNDPTNIQTFKRITKIPFAN